MTSIKQRDLDTVTGSIIALENLWKLFNMFRDDAIKKKQILSYTPADLDNILSKKLEFLKNRKIELLKEE